MTPVRLAILLLTAAVLLSAPASVTAQDFVASALPAADQQRIQEALEFEQTNRTITLPASGGSFTIVRTETRPRICRYFRVTVPGRGEQQGIGCRTGNRVWDVAAATVEVPAAPTVPVPAAPRPSRGEVDGPPVTGGGAAVASLPQTVIVPSAPADTDRDFARPGRRPGTPVPMIAAPPEIRSVPRPERPPGRASAPAVVATTEIDLPIEDPAPPATEAGPETTADDADAPQASPRPETDPDEPAVPLNRLAEAPVVPLPPHHPDRPAPAVAEAPAAAEADGDSVSSLLDEFRQRHDEAAGSVDDGVGEDTEDTRQTVASGAPFAVPLPPASPRGPGIRPAEVDGVTVPVPEHKPTPPV